MLSPMAEINIDDEPGDAAKAKNRQRLRDYRRLQKRQHAFLTQRVRELAAEMATLRSAKPLPWHEVAAVFRDDAHDALATQRSLAAQIDQCGHAARILEAWVRASVPAALASFLPHQAPWTQRRLLAPDALRLQSLSWVTDRLLHNADAVLGSCRRQEQMRVTLHALSYDQTYVVIQSHRIVPAPFVDAVAAQRRIYSHTPGGNFVDRELLQASFGGDIVHEQVGDVRVLYRHYVSERRATMVALSITHDDASPDQALSQEPSYGWTELTPVTQTTTRVLDVWLFLLNTPASESGDNDALSHHARFLHETRAAYDANLAHCNALFLQELPVAHIHDV
ncbi:hypothetical protein SDRG_11065 [Saprolegnia diclina VS20]|uniref:START domain-containing protein n=1 Tax=Saprolegnia diclina (strain VS20) TaxID=1156394 RepID=T0RGR6_SAPDV|nr:hypothetical protein SDRG_11065 [Saprolegnia diclina VS20]EQC31468.1 hypothetical protein SDRG_11065 [Saprolegnia diclina VS20]|eukprot:XP_008615309.1 hypothetical protein SDRG_11065 [Saprolegnia diclina VS20]